MWIYNYFYFLEYRVKSQEVNNSLMNIIEETISPITRMKNVPSM